MAERSSLTVYTKEIVFEIDPEDGTIHALCSANGMDIRIIQNRHFFLKTQANAERIGLELAAQTKGAIVKLSERGPMFLRENHREE